MHFLDRCRNYGFLRPGTYGDGAEDGTYTPPGGGVVVAVAVGTYGAPPEGGT